MATAKNSTLKSRPESAFAPTPVAAKIEQQRDRIFQAMSMIATVNKVLNTDGEVGDEFEESPLWYALRGVHGMLDDIAAQLDSVSLDRLVAHVC